MYIHTGNIENLIENPTWSRKAKKDLLGEGTKVKNIFKPN